MLTPGGEGAALGGIEHVHGRTLDGDQPLIALGVHAGHGAQQAHGVGVAGLVEDVVYRPLLHDLAGIHDGDLVADLSHHAQVVGDEDNAHVSLLLELLHELQNLGLNGHVQSSGGLVGNQQLGVADEAHGDHDTLAHAAGELVRVLLHPLGHVVDAHQLQHLHGPLGGVGLGDFLVVGPQGLDELVAHGVNGIEAGHWVLENHGHLAAPEGGHLLLAEGQDIPALEGDGTADDLAGGLEQAHDGVSLLALAGAGLAHNAHDLVVIQVIADAADGLDLTCGGKEGDPQILDFQQLAGLFVLFH